MREKGVVPALLLLFTGKVSAHCPLCTAGAGAAAGIATYLGIDFAVIGVLIGGFSWALGSWTADWFEKKFTDLENYQSKLVALAIFSSIVLPGYFWMPSATPVTLWMIGEYGTTVSINNFLMGSMVGGGIVLASPSISSKISEYREETLPFQGMILTISGLVLTALLFQLLL